MAVWTLNTEKDKFAGAMKWREMQTKMLPYDTLRIAGEVHVNGLASPPVPIHIEGEGRGSSIVLHDDATIAMNHYGPLMDNGTAFQGCAEGDWRLDLPSAFVSLLRPLDWIYLWAGDALAGVMPHMGTRQCPAEMHQVTEIWPEATGSKIRSVSIREPIMDTMSVNPTVSLRTSMREYRGLTIADLTIIGADDRTSGAAIDCRDVANARIEGVTLDRCGGIMMNSPDCRIDCHIVSQENYSTPKEEGDLIYGVVVGGQCNGFDVRVTGHGCRHVFTTAVGSLSVAGVLCGVGTPSGYARITATGSYIAPVDTHSSGKYIVLEVNASCVPQRTAGAATGCMIRSRNTTIQNSVVDGIRSVGIGIKSLATGLIVRNTTIRNQWIGLQTGAKGTDYVLDGVRFDGVLISAQGGA